MSCKSITKVLSIAFLFIISSCNIEPFEGDVSEGTDDDDTGASCVEATSDAAVSALAYGLVTTADSNYATVCNSYRSILESQILACGDTDGAIQAIIDSLGDCAQEEDAEEEVEETGDYWPMEINNSWTYSAKVTDFPDSESEIKITDLQNYNGEDSYLFENFFGSVQGTDGTGAENLEVDYYSRKSDGEYKIFVGELTAELAGLYRIKQSPYDYVILKDNVDVGSTWDYEFDVTTSYEAIAGGAELPEIVTNYDIDLEILEKDVSVVSDGVTYNSVINVKFVQKVSVAGLPSSTATAEYIYSFAKDVGIVKIEGTLFDGDDNITSNVLQELKSYSLF